MNVISAVRHYVGKIINEASGMKVLLLDQDTTGIVSMVYTQSEILQKEVYLVDRLENDGRETMTHLKAVCFLRPTPDNINRLCRELREPHYGQYFIFFTNVLSGIDLEKMADADEHEVVREVQELYGDYYAINYELFSFNLLNISAQDSWLEDAFSRTSDGLKAVLLSLKKRPHIRYQKNSNLCKRLATDMAASINQESQLFDFRRPDVPPVLLIVDRRDDPVTPLLNQWTYQAMVHEWLTINNHRVDLSKVPNISRELEAVTLSSETDDFFKDHMYQNFGDICIGIKELVDEFQKKSKTSKNIETIADMRDFIDNYPQFKQLSGTVSKHVAIVGELSRLVSANYKLEVSETEQEIAGQGDHGDCLSRIKEFLENPKVTDLDRVRLVLLYALRFEKTSGNAISSLRQKLINKNLSDEYLMCIDAILNYGGHDVRSSDLFGTKSFLGFTKKTLKGLKGVQNVYTQHEPLLQETLDLMLKGKLREVEFPFVNQPMRDRPQDVIVFMVGGVTYEEARTVALFNENNSGMRVVLGGTSVHNCESFLKEVLADTGRVRRF